VERVRTLFGDNADALLKLYPAETDDQAKRSAQDLAGDRFIAFSTWKWIEMQVATESLRYTGMNSMTPRPLRDDTSEPSRGAYHSAEIEFVF